MSELKIYGRLDVKKLARNLPDIAPVVGDDDYKKLKRKLNNYSLPMKNKHHARFTFRRQRPKVGEIIVSYTAWLSEKAKDCEFDNQINNGILEHLTQMIRNDDLLKKSIPKKWNLDWFVEEASQRDDINQQVRDMNDNYKMSKVKHQPRIQLRNGKIKQKDEKKYWNTCNCWKVGLHPPGRNYQPCTEVWKVGRYNHYASCFRAGPISHVQQEKLKEPIHRERISRKQQRLKSQAVTQTKNTYLGQTAQHVFH